MFLHHSNLLKLLLLTSITLSVKTYSDDDASTWTGAFSPNIEESGNWDPNVPYNATAIFNGDGDNSPISNRDRGIDFDQIEFTDSTQVSIITGIGVNSSPGITVHPGVLATFDIYEHQHEFYPPAELRIANGAAGSGGGTVEYNLQGYGQLYAFSGALEDTVVNVIMTEGNNYFEINGGGTSVFDNVSSDSPTDEIALFSNSNLTIQGSESNTIEAIITGEGSVTKSGTGVLILNNDNTYTGDTQVDGGVLELNGSLLGNLLTGSEGTLKGTGTIGGNFVSSGIVSPGNSIGTLSVGNFLPTASNIFMCEINSEGLSDQIVATGSASLMGAIDVIALDLSFTSPQIYNILHADAGITGTFSTVTTTVPALIGLTYDPNDVFLAYLPLSIIHPQGNAAAAFDCFIGSSGSDINTVSSQLLTLTIPEIQKAFNQMQPSQFSAQTWTQLQNAILIRSNYSNHLNNSSKSCFSSDHSHVWIDGIGQWQHQGSKNSQLGYNDWTAGISLGTDTAYKDFRFGGAASYTYSDLRWNQSAGNGQINSYYGGFYGNWGGEVGYVNFTALGAYNQYKTSRHLHFGTLDRHAHANHHGWEALAGIEAGMRARVKQFKLGPFGRIDYIYLSQTGYQESGADRLDLDVESRQDQLLQSQAGIIFTTSYACGSERTSGTFTPSLELSYINQVPLAKQDYYANFVNSTCQFSVSGWNFLRNLGAVGFGLTYLDRSEKVAVSIQYDGQFGSKYWNQSGSLILDIKY